MSHFLWGAIAMACWTVGLFFWRFWRETRDRLFLFFAFAFWVLSLHWVILELAQPSDENRPYIYLARLVAFLLIIAAIIDKNRSRKFG